MRKQVLDGFLTHLVQVVRFLRVDELYAPGHALMKIYLFIQKIT